MYKFDITSIQRDGSLDSIIPLHEAAHGLSNRLTGGSYNGLCLETGESRGMGEGWSDAVGLFLTRKASDSSSTPVSVGWYVLGGADASARGVRSFPYSTNMTVNPQKFSDIEQAPEEHAIGEIWASMLWDMYWNLVDAHGFSDNWLDAKQPEGNIIALQVVVGGMMLQVSILSVADCLSRATRPSVRAATRF